MRFFLKRKVFDQWIIPVMSYGAETWAVTKNMEQKLKTTQRSMERCMLGITKRDRKTCKWIREQTKVQDIIKHITNKKWRWAGHKARSNDNRWNKTLHRMAANDRLTK